MAARLHRGHSTTVDNRQTTMRDMTTALIAVLIAITVVVAFVHHYLL